MTKHALGLGSTRDLLRLLENSPAIAEVCGFSYTLPHEATLSKFFAKLASQTKLHLVKDVSRRLVKAMYSLPGFQQRVAVDSSTLRAYSNGAKKGKPSQGRKGYKARVGLRSDPDAAWAVKKNTHGKTEYTFGFKLHLATCTEHEIPVAANISPGNVHDIRRASNVLSEARSTDGRFHPKFILADKGYSSKDFIELIRRQYNAWPVVDIHPTHKRLKASRWGRAMETPEYLAIRKQRPSVERVFSLLKRRYALNKITVRGLRKVTAHAYLSLIAMQGNYLTRR